MLRPSLALAFSPRFLRVQSGGSAVQNYLEDLLFRIPHLQLVLVTDRDGVQLLKAASDAFGDTAVESTFSSLFSTSSEQASKLGLGANAYIVSTYPAHVILQVNVAPLIVTAVGERALNLGLLINAIPELRAKLEGTRNGVQMHINTERDRDAH